jgi:hypothetical protein
MDPATLGVLIIGSISVIGLTQLCAWVVMTIKNPRFDYMRPDLRPTSSADGRSKPQELSPATR